MNVRLYNDNPGETQTETGEYFDEIITAALRPIVQEAVRSNVSLRDIDYLTSQIISCMTAEECLRRAVNARKAEKSLQYKQH